MEIPNIYQGDYKKLVIFPIILLIVAAIFIPQIKLGVDFKGGVMVSLETKQPVDTKAIAASLEKAGIQGADIQQFSSPVRNNVEIMVEQNDELNNAASLNSQFFSKIDDVSRLESDYSRLSHSTLDADKANAPAAQQKYLAARGDINKIADQLFAIAKNGQKASDVENTDGLRKLVSESTLAINADYTKRLTTAVTSAVGPYDSISTQIVSAALSEQFISKATTVVIISALLTAIVVFLVFRTFVPSIAVMVGAASDVAIAMGAMGLFGIPLTLSSFAALMMLIGFSLDTDMLLTMRVIKRTEGHASERAFDSMKTGMTMSVTALIAFTVLLILGMTTHISQYYEIAAVALAGLVGDIVATWCLNAVIILWHAEKVEHGKNENEKRVLSTIYK